MGALLELGPVTVRLGTAPPFGLLIDGEQGAAHGERRPYLDAVFADPVHREAFFRLVDREGIVVCRDLDVDPAPYRKVGGARSQRRLSQGEFFHHDGCSTPVKPRIVEIRCPPQRVVRTMSTTAAPFPEVVAAMVKALPEGFYQVGPLRPIAEAVFAGESLDWEHAQGLLNRVVRQLDSDTARDYFRKVDRDAGGFTAPWTIGESRFMANNNPGRTVQHRRACHPPWAPGTPNGGLLKRWPNEELSDLADLECNEPDGSCVRAMR